ncbi:hypothetical protein BJ912DRAFT_966851 [Pholiota molesta]|nr:hypothetical protein BJ912DRAFT_966851 [Pholiota molesta]
MTTPPRFLESVYDTYPDDQSTKEVFIQAANISYSGIISDRHVLIWWSNGVDAASDTPMPVRQVIQLTGQAGNYSYFYPVANSHLPDVINENFQASLGELTRVQRDQIVILSKAIVFEKKSTVNGCHAWTRDLLDAMVTAELLSQERFHEIVRTIPLVRRRAEV